MTRPRGSRRLSHRLRSIKAIRRDLDEAFSLFIRRRDADENGMGRCVTCNQWRILQCGHFVKRQHKAVRWDERNAAGQCVRCNKWLHGNDGFYALALIKKYGQSIVEELLQAKHRTVHFTREDYNAMLERFKS